MGLELIDPETREPVTGRGSREDLGGGVDCARGGRSLGARFFRASGTGAGVLPVAAASHFASPTSACWSFRSSRSRQLAAIVERFAGETFGVRAGGLLAQATRDVEAGLAERGVDALPHWPIRSYLFCAVCDFENGFLTVAERSLVGFGSDPAVAGSAGRAAGGGHPPGVALRHARESRRSARVDTPCTSC